MINSYCAHCHKIDFVFCYGLDPHRAKLSEESWSFPGLRGLVTCSRKCSKEKRISRNNIMWWNMNHYHQNISENYQNEINVRNVNSRSTFCFLTCYWIFTFTQMQRLSKLYRNLRLNTVLSKLPGAAACVAWKLPKKKLAWKRVVASFIWSASVQLPSQGHCVRVAIL